METGTGTATATATATDFETVTSWPARGATAEGSYPRSWAQGRATFGGAVAATAYRLASTLVDKARRPLTVDCAFFGPVAAEVRATCEARVLREGKYVTSVESTIAQAGQLCARTLVSFGLPRASGIVIDEPPRVLPARTAEPVPHLEGLTPTFLQHFELTWMQGAYPFTGAKEHGIAGYCRHRTRANGVEAVLGLLDAWPGPMLPLLDGPGVASTVRWAAHLSDLATFDPHAYTYFDSRVVAAHDGYASTIGHLYDARGRAIAWSEQLVAFFEPKR